MELNTTLILIVIVAVFIAFGIYMFAKDGRIKTLKRVYGRVKDLYDDYGEDIRKEDPLLDEEIKSTLAIVEKALRDDIITFAETFQMTAAFTKLIARIIEYTDGNK